MGCPDRHHPKLLHQARFRVMISDQLALDHAIRSSLPFSPSRIFHDDRRESTPRQRLEHQRYDASQRLATQTPEPANMRLPLLRGLEF
jgi:hypothetical protein